MGYPKQVGVGFKKIVKWVFKRNFTPMFALILVATINQIPSPRYDRLRQNMKIKSLVTLAF